MTSLKEYIVRQSRTRPPSRTAMARRPVREDAGDVSVMRSPGLDAASVMLPAGIDLDDQAPA